MKTNKIIYRALVTITLVAMVIMGSILYSSAAESPSVTEPTSTKASELREQFMQKYGISTDTENKVKVGFGTGTDVNGTPHEWFVAGSETTNRAEKLKEISNNANDISESAKSLIETSETINDELSQSVKK